MSRLVATRVLVDHAIRRLDTGRVVTRLVWNVDLWRASTIIRVAASTSLMDKTLLKVAIWLRLVLWDHVLGSLWCILTRISYALSLRLRKLVCACRYIYLRLSVSHINVLVRELLIVWCANFLHILIAVMNICGVLYRIGCHWDCQCLGNVSTTLCMVRLVLMLIWFYYMVCVVALSFLVKSIGILLSCDFYTLARCAEFSFHLGLIRLRGHNWRLDTIYVYCLLNLLV